MDEFLNVQFISGARNATRFPGEYVSALPTIDKLPCGTQQRLHPLNRSVSRRPILLVTSSLLFSARLSCFLQPFEHRALRLPPQALPRSDFAFVKGRADIQSYNRSQALWKQNHACNSLSMSKFTVSSADFEGAPSEAEPADSTVVGCSGPRRQVGFGDK
jgi:hypothetical protein